MTGLRLLHVVANVNRGVGGPARSVPALLEEMARGGAATVLATLDDASLGPLPAPRGYRLESLALGSLGRALRGWSPPFARLLCTLAASADVVHGHGLWMWPNLYARRAAERAARPLVVSPRGMLQSWALERSAWRKALAWRLVERTNLQQARLFHATSAQEAEAIREAGLRQPIACIPNGVEAAAGTPPDRALLEARHPALRGRRWCLFLSRLHPVKGLPELLRAWAGLRERWPEWHLLIAGEAMDGYGAALQAQARALGIDGAATFAGRLEGEAKACALGHADLFVLPTHSESFGLAIAEALAHGVPVITTRAAPWPELSARRCGWWIDAGEAPLHEALHEALAQPAERLRDMGARGRELVATQYAWPAVAAAMMAAYRWMLEGGTRPACVRAD